MSLLLATNLVGWGIGILFLGLGITVVVFAGVATAVGEANPTGRQDSEAEGAGGRDQEQRAIDRLS